MPAQCNAQMLEAAVRFWDLGNYLVAFAVVQMLAFLYGLERERLLERLRDVPIQMVAVIVLSGVLSGGLIWGAYDAEIHLLLAAATPDVMHRMSERVFIGRLLIISLITLVGIVGFLAARAGPKAGRGNHGKA